MSTNTKNRSLRTAVAGVLAFAVSLVATGPTSAAPSLGGVTIPSSGPVIPEEPLLTPTQANWISNDYPELNDDFPPVCRWEMRNGQMRHMLYVKIEDQRTPTRRLKVSFSLETSTGNEGRPIRMRPGVEDFEVDITDHLELRHPSEQIGRIGVDDREGYYSGFTIDGACGVAHAEPFNYIYN